MIRPRTILSMAILAVMTCCSAHAFAPADSTAETDPLVLKKLEWFQDQKFGLLMHWGTYSQWQIVESWSLCPEDEDWCERRGEHAQDYFEYKRAYENLKTTFNPVGFDPDAVGGGRLERRHALRRLHDQAPRRLLHVRHQGDRLQDHVQGLPLPARIHGATSPARSSPPSARRDSASGAYFSKPDWHCPDYWWPYFPPLDRNVNYEIAKYPKRWEAFKTFTRNQIQELMSNYGPMDILWLDGGWVQPDAIRRSRRWARTLPARTSTCRGSPRWRVRCSPDSSSSTAPSPAAIRTTAHPSSRSPRRRPTTSGRRACRWRHPGATSPPIRTSPTHELVHLLVDIVAKGGNLLLEHRAEPGGHLRAGRMESSRRSSARG